MHLHLRQFGEQGGGTSFERYAGIPVGKRPVATVIKPR